MPTEQQEAAPRFTDQSKIPTPASEWKSGRASESEALREDSFIVDLPSGNTVEMTRTVDMTVMLATGQIPNPLAGIVQKMIDSKTPNFPAEAGKDQKAMMQLLDLLNENACRVIISPKFAMPAKRSHDENGVRRKGPEETPEDYMDRLGQWTCPEGFVSAWDLSMDDRLYIFAVAQGAAADLASFRLEQERNVEHLQASNGVRSPTKRTGGTRPKKKK